MFVFLWCCLLCEVYIFSVKMAHSRTILNVLNVLVLGICLSSADVGTVMNLGIRLALNGHLRWSLCVLGPIFTNVLFTFFACAKLEKEHWWRYAPLVILQVYPQYCMGRILYEWATRKLDREEFIKQRDNIDGGLGCVYSYIGSVPQVFIQTAFFTVANTLSNTLSRLCYNDKSRLCESFDNYNCTKFNDCSLLGYDNNGCSPIGYLPYHYKSYEEIQECKEKTHNCTVMFKQCIKKLTVCLSTCYENLTSRIENIDENELLENYFMQNANSTNHFLSLEYGASKEDFQKIQLYLFFIAHKSMFLSTYLISIFAAAYGISKYFRVSYSRHCDDVIYYPKRNKYMNDGLNPRTFGLTFIIIMVYLFGKALALASFMIKDENEMIENLKQWLLFCMLPSFSLAIAVIFSRTFYKTNRKLIFGYSLYGNGCISVFLREPAVVGVALVTPFMYVPATLKCTRMEDYDNKPSIGISSKMAFFMLDYRLAYVNHFITVCMTTIGLILKSQIKLEILLPCAAFLLFFTTFLLHRVNKCDDEHNKRCFKHAEEKSACTDCAQRYGVYMKSYTKLNFKQLKKCEKHQLVCLCPVCSKYQ